jgi:hypothetical protein
MLSPRIRFGTTLKKVRSAYELSLGDCIDDVSVKPSKLLGPVCKGLIRIPSEQNQQAQHFATVYRSPDADRTDVK